MTAGLLMAQVIGTVQVALSNRALAAKLSAIEAAGWLTVPGGRALAGLATTNAAVAGGLFFTLTVGAALTLISAMAARIWLHWGGRRPRALIPGLTLWAGCLVMLNQQGFEPLVSAYPLVICPMVFWLRLRMGPALPGPAGPWPLALHSLGIALLAGLGAFQADSHTFTDLRDRLLLSTPAGLAVTDFYYRYTLYPAQVFKSPEQQQTRSFHIDPALSPDLNRRISAPLVAEDYFPVPDDGLADLVIRASGDGLSLSHRGREIMTIPTADLLREPRRILKDFSREGDRYVFFRVLTFYGLILALITAAYAGAVLVVSWPCRRFIPDPGRTALVIPLAAVVLVLGVGAAFYQAGRFTPLAPADLAEALASPDPDRRLTALRTAAARNLDLLAAPTLEISADSPLVLERFWLARALHHGRGAAAYDLLIRLSADPQRNVAYTALSVLGRRGDARAVGTVLERLRTTDDWYIQMYAYRTLRKLGWRQHMTN